MLGIYNRYIRVPLKGYYKGTIRVPLKGSIRVWSFRKSGVPYFGVLIIRYYIRVPYFRKLPYNEDGVLNPES